jgi:LacI family transcriptional regulator, gluconate utilization system Gnt-I transcriptional repressor
MARRRSNGRPTIADVAARAGVGAITVSRALRDPSRVSARLRESIARAIRELDYVPDLNARALASQHSNMVAVLIPAISQNIFTDVLRGVYDGVEDSGLRIEIANTRYQPDVEERLVADLLRHRPAGAIISGTGQSAATRRMLEAAACPVIQIMDLTDDPIQKIIGFSHFDAGRQMTEHLIEAGYRRIGFIGGMMNGRSLGRLAGYRAALEAAGLFDPRLIAVLGPLIEGPQAGPVMGHEFANARMGRDLTGRLLERYRDVDAVFCNTDVLAIGALFACLARGVRVPEDFGIAGFNDFDYMAAAEPSMSSVRTHRWRCGHAAMLAVREMLAGAPPRERVVDLGVEIMRRRSTDRAGLLAAAQSAPTDQAGGPSAISAQ